MAAAETGYTARNIRVLEGLEAVRTRPGMYIGSVSTRGLNHLIYEIVDNSVDEHLAGYCDSIYVTLEEDELAVGEWFLREEMPERRNDISLTAEMMEQFRLGKEPRREN